MDLVCSSDDDIVNPEYKEDIKTEAKSVKKSVKKSLKKAVKANSVAKKAMGRPRATPTEIKDSVHILSDSITSKIKDQVSCEQITTDITGTLIGLDDSKLTSYISYIESFDTK